MITCHNIERALAQNSASNNTALHIADTVTLDETDRHRRRLLLTSDTGIEFLLELESVTLLRHGDILRLSDGRGIRVQAKPESLYEIRGNDAAHLLKLTWHVGNRHLASQIFSDHVRIRSDAVIRTMLEQLGAQVTAIADGFNPEGGAYGDAPAGHDHQHAHDHHHAHQEEPEHNQHHTHEEGHGKHRPRT